MNRTILDFDDFSVDNNRIMLFDRWKAIEPELKVTFFTVIHPFAYIDLGISLDESVAILRKWKKRRPWIEYCVHGFNHSFKECGDWSKQQTVDLLSWVETLGFFEKGFKAPHWETSVGLYEGLLSLEGWWIADHPKNDHRRPPELLSYVMGNDVRVTHAHGHIQNWGSNGFCEKWNLYRKLKPPFMFVSEYVGGLL